MPIYLNGLILGFSLIMALGPQNIFLIRQGAMRNHALLSVLVCFFSDVILITGSVAGLHQLLEIHKNLSLWMVWFGAAFLLYYGFGALKQAFSKHKQPLIQKKQSISRQQIVMMALGFSLLNPHAIIDSLVLIGGGSGRFPGHQRLFLFGVLSSSMIWFSLITFTAHYFSELLTRRTIWRCIEWFSGVLMIGLSIRLVMTVLS